MIHRLAVIMVSMATSLWPALGLAFRNCHTDDSHAYHAATQYTVAEIEFDQITGTASGTKTIYNYANFYGEGDGECHITYQFSGSYTPGADTFVLDAERTNFSRNCPQEIIDNDFPQDLTYSFQVHFGLDGSTSVSLADNGELIAMGSWESGRTVYKTAETCTKF